MFTRRLVTCSVPVALICALAVAGCDSSSDSNDASSDTGSDTPATSTTTTGDSSSEPGETSGSATEPEPTDPATSEPSDGPSGSTSTKATAGDQHSVLSSLPGSSSSACVTIGNDDRTVRSGDLAVGDFEQARQGYGDSSEGQEQTTVHMFVVPGDAKPMNGVTVRMTPAGSKGQAASVHSQSVQQADVWKYYAVDVPVPAPGTWKLVATTGHESGCFRVTFVR